MASTSRYGYQKLTKFESLFQDERSSGGGSGVSGGEIKLSQKVIRQRSFNRFRKFQFKRRLKLRIPRLFTRKARLIRAAWRKVVKRLKENQGHFGDLFAGNYLFMQVSPSSLKTVQNISKSLANNCSSVARDLSSRQMAP